MKFFYSLILMLMLSTQNFAFASVGSGFDFPVGKPNATGYYDAQGFGEYNSSFGGYHLGEDWNRVCGGDCDLGDPIYSIAEGRVKLVASRRVWGNVVIIEHEGVVNALYAHLKEVYVKKDQLLMRGDKIGTMGKGDKNIFAAHLHFEIRNNLSIGIGSGYGAYKPKGWLDPSLYIKSNRPRPPVVASALEGEVKFGRANLNWSESPFESFDKYEVYRSESEGGTKEQNSRTLVSTITNRSETTLIDEFVMAPKKDYHYAILTLEKDGRSAISNEIRLRIEHEIINLTNSEFDQRSPRVQGRYVVWRDLYREKTTFPMRWKLNYYDLELKELGWSEIGSLFNRLEGPYSPDVYGDWVCYQTEEAASTKGEIYCHSLKGGYDIPITDNYDHDYSPRISSSGYIVWTKSINNNQKLYALNLNNALGEYLVVDAPHNQFHPSISGDIVVWKDTRVGNRTDIYMKNLSDGGEVLLATNTGSGAVEISGDYITWVNKGVAYLMNIKTKEQTIIDNGDARISAIDGDRVAYFKYDEGSYGNIHIYSIKEKSYIKIQNPLYWMPAIDIYEDVLVFTAPGPTAMHDTAMDIFLTYL